jgi:hypothetical protein
MKIYCGKMTPEHKGDTSRELLDMWEESGYCEIIRGATDDVFIWAQAPGDILLYEYDRYDVYPKLPPRWNYGLFAGMQHPQGSPWIYWGRHPRQLEAKIAEGIREYDERTISSIFLGKVENGVQLKNRTAYEWQSTIEIFSMPIRMGDSFKWPFTQSEYLEKVSDSKFGLCMPGYGPKCNREIELMGLGVVPLIIDNVCTTYFDPLIEGQHFLRATAPSDIPRLVNECPKDRWGFMSHNCRQWYERNCSRLGSYRTTERIIRGMK